MSLYCGYVQLFISWFVFVLSSFLDYYLWLIYFFFTELVNLFMYYFYCCCSVAKSCSALCNPIDCSTPGFPCPSLSPGVCWNSFSLSHWCHPTISSSVTPWGVTHFFLTTSSYYFVLFCFLRFIYLFYFIFGCSGSSWLPEDFL